MPGLYSKYIKPIHAIGDASAIVTSIISSSVILFGKVNPTTTNRFLELIIFSLLTWFVCSSFLKSYKFYRVTNLTRIILNVLKVIALFIIILEATLNITEAEANRQFLLLAYALLTGLIISWRVSVVLSLRYARKKGYNYRKVIIVGFSKTAIDLRRFFVSRPEYGYRFLGFFDDHNTDKPYVVGSFDEIQNFVLENGVDEIYCSPFNLKRQQIVNLLDFVDNNLVRMKFLPEPGELPYRQMKVDFYDVLPVLIFRSIPLDDVVNKVIKRTFDIVFSLAVIILILSWLIPILGILIKLNSKGPVFFKQYRTGLDNKKFKCWKLRTMTANGESDSQQAKRGDARITSIGAFLRKTSLDEFPQFFNVLRGNMSVVGPRPHMLQHTEQYSRIVNKFMVRHFIKPGITGLSQVRGFRGETTEVHQMRGRIKLDIFYLEHWSFFLDMKIIFHTVINIFRGEDNAF
ncbi:undecaprenyl-phosphate glucose phosphotransferase [Pontibacter sp. BT310]|uniref:Undecaprenyl-phosphate glucose phosphotransferase n=1 Tax=Pontibacter populi TaxID=890055 RepID=A0ABS6XBE7_9BACT|nr:undecaprenyl-phosphate glucose phosphotransferase [Pontibacter populi]MBJ6118430.1 undecaprenyl-phosphate glucose phosphotransferase [Pontibacter sp. BT310]MBR0570858.1 undecaprenyl-phosphate glucose phosphotransferase [Microvirga sp. STS03]MBW3365284.1 undecaprenyl-phosphate glucose phosphotransferase [Pontibacter populi]